MSDLAAFATGVGIGIVIVIPVLFALRHEIADAWRRLLGLAETAEKPTNHDEASKLRVGSTTTAASGGGVSDGFTPAVAFFGISASVVAMVAGLVLDDVIFTVSGAFSAVCVLVGFVVSRAVARN